MGFGHFECQLQPHMDNNTPNFSIFRHPSTYVSVSVDVLPLQHLHINMKIGKKQGIHSISDFTFYVLYFLLWWIFFSFYHSIHEIYVRTFQKYDTSLKWFFMNMLHVELKDCGQGFQYFPHIN